MGSILKFDNDKFRTCLCLDHSTIFARLAAYLYSWQVSPHYFADRIVGQSENMLKTSRKSSRQFEKYLENKKKKRHSLFPSRADRAPGDEGVVGGGLTPFSLSRGCPPAIRQSGNVSFPRKPKAPYPTDTHIERGQPKPKNRYFGKMDQIGIAQMSIFSLVKTTPKTIFLSKKRRQF